MSSHDGFYIGGIHSGAPSTTSTAISDWGGVGTTFGVVDVSLESGAWNSTQPTDAVPTPHTGYELSSYLDILYGHVYVTPRELDLGLIMSDMEFEVHVWNAELDRPLHIIEYRITQANGITVEFETPQNVAPIGEASGRIIVHARGPARQNTTITLVTERGEHRLEVRGSRVLMFPFEPDWSGGLRMGLAWDTVLARNNQGKEQRRALNTRPLRTLRVRLWGRGQDSQRLHNLVQRGKDRVFGVPVYTEPVRLEAIEGEGSLLRCATDLSRLWHLRRLCDLVMLLCPQTGQSIAKSVSAVDAEAGTITLKTAITSLAADPSQLVLYPLFLGLVETATPRTHTDTFEVWDVEFREMAGTGQPRMSAPDPLPEIWPYRPEWSEEPTGVVQILRNTTEIRGGVREVFSKVETAPARLVQSYTLSGDGLYSFHEHLAAARGRYGRTVVRDPRVAFELLEPAGQGTSMIRCVDNGFADVVRGGERLAVVLPGGDVLRATVETAAPAEAGAMFVTVEEALPVEVPPAARIYREYPMRLDQDAVELDYETTDYARARLSFVELLGDA